MHDSEGRYCFGTSSDPDGGDIVEVTVYDDRMWGQIFLAHDIGCRLLL